MWLPAKNVLVIVSGMDTLTVLTCAETVQMYVPYVPDLKPVIQLFVQSCVLYVQKFVRLVPKNVVSTPTTIKVAKNVQQHVRNVQKFAQNWRLLLLKRKCVMEGGIVPLFLSRI